MEKIGSERMIGLTESGWMHKHTHKLAGRDIDTWFAWSLIYYIEQTADDLKMLEEVEQSMVIMDSYFDQITKLGEVLNVVILLNLIESKLLNIYS